MDFDTVEINENNQVDSIKKELKRVIQKTRSLSKPEDYQEIMDYIEELKIQYFSMNHKRKYKLSEKTFKEFLLDKFNGIKSAKFEL